MVKLKKVLVGAGMALLAGLFMACPNPSGNDANNNVGNTSEEKKDDEKPQEITRDFTQTDNVIKNASGWAFIAYDLSEFRGKDIIIDFSADMKVTNNSDKDALMKWQINNDPGYPTIAEETFGPGVVEKTVKGKNTDPITLSGDKLYLSTYDLTNVGIDLADIEIELKNVKYTVTYGGSGNEEPELPAKEYPTDIFTVADTKIADFTAAQVFDGSQASNITFNADGTVTYITDGVGSGRGVVFYIKDKDSVINVSNYDSIDIELVCSPITGKWNPKAKTPSFGFRLYTPEASGFWSGFEDIEYFGFENGEEYGKITKNIKITDDWVEKYVDSCDNDDIMGFALKFNAYQRGNDESDQIKVQIKKVQFNKKPGTPEDKKTDDGLTDAQRGKVESIKYASHDWAKGDETPYEKPAWVYLPAGYDPEDKDTKYPLFILMHGFGQNQDTWGLTDKGTGGKIKGYMDRGMANGSVEKFILVVPTGVASASYANGSGQDFNGYNAFGGELRNDLIPYMRANYNIKEGRDNVAMAGLSMGGNQTFNKGILECLDLISYFGTFSGATFDAAATYIDKVEAVEEFKDLKIHFLYMINGDADTTVTMSSFNDYVDNMKKWDRVEKFESEVYPGGTHDFPVWYRGFKHIIPYLFRDYSAK